MDELMEHKAGEGQEVQACPHAGQPLVIARQAAEASGPGEAAFHDAALGQQDKAPLGLGQLDHLQADAVRGGHRGDLVTGVALVHIRQFDVVAAVTACTSAASVATWVRSSSLAGVTASANR
jgi:hypothetical protein